jgi:hypothetical protein
MAFFLQKKKQKTCANLAQWLSLKKWAETGFKLRHYSNWRTFELGHVRQLIKVFLLLFLQKKNNPFFLLLANILKQSSQLGISLSQQIRHALGELNLDYGNLPQLFRCCGLHRAGRHVKRQAWWWRRRRGGRWQSDVGAGRPVVVTHSVSLQKRANAVLCRSRAA